jgi:hypothetical protein
MLDNVRHQRRDVVIFSQMSGVTDREGTERKGDTFFRYGTSIFESPSQTQTSWRITPPACTLEHLVDKDLPSFAHSINFFAWETVKLTAWSPNFPQSDPT